METPQSKRNSPDHSVSQPCSCAQRATSFATVAKRLGLLAITIGLATGCSVIRVYDPQSGKVIYESKRLGNSLKIGEVSARSGTNIVIIKGYENDQVQAFKAGVALAEALISKAP